MSIPKEVQQQYDKVATDFASYLEKKLVNTLSRKKFNVTRELVQSIRTSVTGSTPEALASVRLEFYQYGKYIEMGKLYWSQQPPVDIIQEWVEAVGIEKFKKGVPGYKGNGPQYLAANRIAWAIVRAKKIRFKSSKRNWKGEDLRTALKHLTHLVAENFAQYAANHVIAGVEGKSVMLNQHQK